jgi:hypothetical protein
VGQRRESHSAQRMSQFIAGMLAPTFSWGRRGRSGPCSLWGSRAAPTFTHTSNYTQLYACINSGAPNAALLCYDVERDPDCCRRYCRNRNLVHGGYFRLGQSDVAAVGERAIMKAMHATIGAVCSFEDAFSCTVRGECPWTWRRCACWRRSCC